MTRLQQQLEAGLAGRYHLERELGEGGMAVVFLAQDLRHDRKVAVKVLRPDLSAAIGAERFLREIKLAAGLNHPHILPLYDSGQAGELLFYVMPNMEGRSLRERLQRERQLPLSDAIAITREVASALDYAHRHQVVHRDIKPENILLHEGSAMVADFGIGKALSADGSLTQTGMVMGTPIYMSPEQAAGDPGVDGRTDLYSLACVLFEMLTGEPPFTGATPQAIIAKRFVSPIPKVRVARDVPEAVDDALTRALARTPVDRFATAAQFGEALRGINGSGPSEQATAVGRTPASSPARKAIAVLPLANMSADPENEYFSDGMTEEIINALAKVPGVQVASRTSSFAFKGKEVDVRTIGEKLGVSSVLEGSVRKVGNRVRITAQLINVADGYHLWSETYDRQLEDVFAIQDEISHAIVDALKLRLGSDAETLVAPAKNIEAYTLYLKGRFVFNKDTEPSTRKALDFFQQSLLQDPGYARSYAGIADCWTQLADDFVVPDDAYPRAKAAATRALQHDPDLVEAITSVGKVLCWYEWDFAAAARQLRRAVALNENHAEAHWALGSVLPTVGLLPEAVEEMRKGLILDPLSAVYSRWLGRFLLFGGDYARAIAQAEKTIDLDADYAYSYLDIGSAYLELGDPEAALQWLQRGQGLENSVRSYDATIVRALAPLGRREEADEILHRLEDESRQHYVRSEILAMGYAAVGDRERAFAGLERAFQVRSAGLIYLHVDPGYKPLRADPRFGQLVERIGLR
ncbi:MAG TPA: protein kinase [Gemmatimonadales bacterium]|jgi:serine/threonine-protein kinase|nr:protein kinase [Gemmatimonadales bacterium]